MHRQVIKPGMDINDYVDKEFTENLGQHGRLKDYTARVCSCTIRVAAYITQSCTQSQVIISFDLGEEF